MTVLSPWLIAALALGLAACGGGEDRAHSSAAASAGSTATSTTRERAAAADLMTTKDAARFAAQATFGPTEALIAGLRSQGAPAWITAQLALRDSRYSLGNGDAIDKNTSAVGFCSQPANTGAYCWRDWYSSQPLVWDFYRNAVNKPDQLRQRMALALQQMLVVSGTTVSGTYGLRNYHNMLLDNAFGNYRTVLGKVARSPVMGLYLNNVNNSKDAPNENFARELLQLFSIGTCALNADGSLQGGTCTPTFANKDVREYAYALTGWTFPAAGATSYGCWPKGTNCRYLGADMTPLPAYHDTSARTLLAGVTVPAGSTADQALERVLDSLIQHPNIAPFVGKRLIQQFVTSNPSAAYVSAVSQAFRSGRYSVTEGTTSYSFGLGQPGDLAATIAAVLLHAEARPASPPQGYGKLREPMVMATAVLRALNGSTDGDFFGWVWGPNMREPLFSAPSVFGFFSPTAAVPGSSTLVGPEFGADDAPSALARLNYLTALIYWPGATADKSVPGAIGTKVDLTPFQANATDAAALVDRLSLIAIGTPLPAVSRAEVIKAVEAVTAANTSTWIAERTSQAAYLVFASPDFQVQP